MILHLDKTGWKHVTFGDVVRNVNLSVRDPESAGIDRLIAMEHLDPGELKITRWGPLVDGTTFTRRVTPGQTLFGKRRAYQRKIAYAEFDAICSGDILTFEADDSQLLPEFLPFLVQSNRFYELALGTSAGSLSPRTNWRDLSTFEFDLPPIDQQKDIANLLWTTERHQLQLQESAAAVEATLQTFLGRAFSATCGPSIAIHDLCTDVVGGVWGSPQGDDEVNVLALGPRVYAHSATDLVTDGSPIRSITRRQAEKRLVREGDIILERSGGSPTQPVGRVVIAGPDLPPCVPTDFQRLLRPNKSLVEPGYLFWRLRYDWLAGLTRDYSRKTTNITNLSVKDYIARELRVPSLKNQAHLLSQVSEFESALSALSAELTAVRRLKAAILAHVVGDN